jgi:hypothetical protein
VYPHGFKAAQVTNAGTHAIFVWPNSFSVRVNLNEQGFYCSGLTRRFNEQIGMLDASSWLGVPKQLLYATQSGWETDNLFKATLSLSILLTLGHARFSCTL